MITTRVIELPKYLIRIDDCERYNLNPDGTYSNAKSQLRVPYKYEFERLMLTGRFRYPLPQDKLAEIDYSKIVTNE